MSDQVNKEYQATPAATLEQQIMNPNFPKNEREWWAAARIEQLEAEAQTRTLDYLGQVGQLSDELERLRAALRGAEAWLQNWAVHAGRCEGGNGCTCGLTAIRFDTRAALGERA